MRTFRVCATSGCAFLIRETEYLQEIPRISWGPMNEVFDFCTLVETLIKTLSSPHQPHRFPVRVQPISWLPFNPPDSFLNLPTPSYGSRFLETAALEHPARLR